MNGDVWNFTGNNHAKSCRLLVPQNTNPGVRKHTFSRKDLIPGDVRRYGPVCRNKS